MSLFDSIQSIGLLLIFAVAAFASFVMISEFNTAIQGADIPQVAKDDSTSFSTAYPGVMDWFFMAFFFGLPIVAMGLAYTNFIPSTFFYASIGVMLLMVFVGFAMADGWLQFASDPINASYLASLPVMNHIMSNIGWYGILYVIIIGYGTYVKFNRQDGYGGGFV